MPSGLKEKVKRIVEQRRLCSCMNDTKWNELRSAMMNEMPFQPPYIVKFLFDEQCFGEAEFQNGSYHTADWYYALSIEGLLFDAAFAVEWIKVRPSYLKNAGRLIKPQVISAENEFIAILKKYNIPFEEKDGVYCIYGYR